MCKKTDATESKLVEVDGQKDLSAVQEKPAVKLKMKKTLKKQPFLLSCIEGPVRADGVKPITFSIDPEHMEACAWQIVELFGAFSVTLYENLWQQIVDASAIESASAAQNTLEIVYDLGPQDAAEGLLISQMVACHNTAMKCLQQAHAQSFSFNAKMVQMKMAARLMQLFTEQMRTLNRYRGKGEQKMTVEHVHVNSGGQAVIGNVAGSRGGEKRKDE